MNEKVRLVVNALLDIQIAFDPDQNSEAAMDMATADLMSIPGVVDQQPAQDGLSEVDVTVLLSGVNMLVAQLLGRLSDANGHPREATVSDLREWVNEILS